MKKTNKIIMIVIATIIVLSLVTVVLIIKTKSNKYSIERPINEYNIKNDNVKKEYLDKIKTYIKSDKLKDFIDYDYINLYGYNNNATGEAALREMEVDGYSHLFNSLFNKERINFDDCPVTDNFKEKFKENLLKHFSLIEGEDCVSVCMFDYDEKTLEVTVYSNFENTEPTYQNIHHFHYTLDSDGNVDDVIFDYTEQ